jgi:hypothetical protein
MRFNPIIEKIFGKNFCSLSEVSTGDGLVKKVLFKNTLDEGEGDLKTMLTVITRRSVKGGR